MVGNNTTINVAYCSSNLFSEVCAVSIVSMFENNKHLQGINVYILEDHISEKNKKRFMDMADKYGRNIIFIPMPMPYDFYKDKRYTFDTVGRTFGRMIWGDILPESVHKLISLDSDTMILGDVEPLWNYDLKGKPIAGVDDCMGRVAMVKTQHLKEDTVHCNAGMYVIDLDVWRKENWTELFHKYINDLFDKGIALVDQIINNGYIKLPLFLLRKSRPIDISNDKQQAHDLLLQNTNRFSGQVLLSISPVFPAASVLSFC